MKNLKKVLAVLSLTTFISLDCVNIYANIFNDVSKDNIAYSSIEKMSKLGLMVGDLQGNFKPDSYISKFDTMKILSKFIQSEENIDTAKSKYNDIILEYDEKYNRWDSSANSSMIILLEKGILNEQDLNDFIILDQNNKEQVRALSKEEIALFLVRLEGKEANINNMNFNKSFKDENNINSNNIKSCYYMDNLGIVTSIDNSFYPKNAVTKAELATILDKFLQYTNMDIKSNQIQPLDNVQTIQTRFVTIENVFIESNSIQTKIGNETKIYSIDKNSSIYIDDIVSDLSNIESGNNAEITIQDNIITKIDIKTNLQIKDIQSDENTKMYGIIKNVSTDSIGLSYKEIDDNGFYIKEKIDIIPVSSDCKITKNGITVNSIDENSLATIILDNKIAKQIILEDENALFIGSIIEKSKDKITIKTIDDKIFEMGFIDDAKIIRNNNPSTIKDLKIGDTINIIVNKDKISTLEAKGSISKIQGIIKSIKINQQASFIEIEENNGKISTYFANNSTADIYSVKVLDSVTLYLDSYEVYAIDILERKYNKNFSGEIIEIDDNSITIFTQDLTGKSTTKVFIDKDTVFFDYETLKNVSIKNIKKGDKVYIVIKNNIDNIASNINIVSK